MEMTFTVSQDAKACGVSRKTITRRLPDLAEAGATKTAQGWVLPVSSLLAVGLNPGKPSDPPASSQPPVEGAGGLVTIPRDEYETLRAKQAQADRLVAELDAVARLAQERQNHIEDLRLALRVLEPAPAPEPLPTAVGQVAPIEAAAQPRRRWWSR